VKCGKRDLEVYYPSVGLKDIVCVFEDGILRSFINETYRREVIEETMM
jgi:hypothetical protein